jgi:hypothetical protein
MICQDCGVEAETKYVALYQNIGALVIRFPKSIEGNLCKSCIHRHFWSMSTTTFFLGWWGTISFIVTPFFLLNNFGRYLMCLGMSPPPPGAARPHLDEAVFNHIAQHADDLFSRINAGEPVESACTATAARAGVTPGQVMLFLQVVAQSQQAG